MDDVDEYTNRLKEVIRFAVDHIAKYSKHKDDCTSLTNSVPKTCSCGERHSRLCILGASISPKNTEAPNMNDQNQWGPYIVGALTTCNEIQPEKATPQAAARSIHHMHKDRLAKDKRIVELEDEVHLLRDKLRDARPKSTMA